MLNLCIEIVIFMTWFKKFCVAIDLKSTLKNVISAI